MFSKKDNSHYVYLFKDVHSNTYKIGLTQFIKSRNREFIFYKNLQVILYARFTPLKNSDQYIEYARRKAFKFETFLCKMFREKVITGREWFSLDNNDVETIEGLIEFLSEETQGNDFMRVTLTRTANHVLSSN